MKLQTWVLGAAASLGLAFVTTAHAMPKAGSATDVATTASGSSLVYEIAARHCWRRNGVRHCTRHDEPRVYRYRNGGSDYYEHDANSLPFGSQRWWDQMLRENRLNPGGGRG